MACPARARVDNMEIKNIQRITTRYDEQEDRFRLDALLSESDTISFWLTQRLLIRIIQHCLKTSREQSGDAFENQQLSQTNHNHSPEKYAKEPEVEETVVVKSDTPSFVIQEVDINSGPAGVVLIFKETKCSYSLALDHSQLRQWLQIVYNLWLEAEWLISVWPDLVTQSRGLASEASISIH